MQVLGYLGCDGGSESSGEVPEVFSGSIDERPVLTQVPGDARLKVGKELLVSGRLDESLIIFDTVLQDRPDLARAHFLNTWITLRGANACQTLPNTLSECF